MVFAFGVLTGSPGIASANGGATLLASQESGPYHIDVSIFPSRAVVGKNHVSILLRSLASGEVLTTANVDISATGPPGAATVGPAAAPNDVSPSFYEADLVFDLAGGWQMTVAVFSDLGETTIVVPMEVKEGGGGFNFILATALAVIVLAVVVFFWGRLPGRNKPRNRES